MKNLLFILFSLITLASCSTETIEPIEPQIETVQTDTMDWSKYEKLAPIKKVIDGKTYTVAPKGVATAVGVICKNGVFLPMGERLGQHCMCGQYSIEFWVYPIEDLEI